MHQARRCQTGGSGAAARGGKSLWAPFYQNVGPDHLGATASLMGDCEAHCAALASGPKSPLAQGTKSLFGKRDSRKQEDYGASFNGEDLNGSQEQGVGAGGQQVEALCLVQVPLMRLCKGWVAFAEAVGN